jgi:Carboxypeptidase regulatory-like domain
MIEGRRLHGTVTDFAERKPMADISVQMEKLVSGAPDRIGLFRLKGLPPGPFTLGVDKSGYTPGSATITPEAHEVELTLPSRPEGAE